MQLWWTDLGYIPGVYQAALQLSRARREKIRWKKKILEGQDKDSLIRQKKMLYVEAKENKRFLLYFASADDDQPLPGKQVVSRCSGFCRRHTSQIMKSLPSSFFSLHFYV